MSPSAVSYAVERGEFITMDNNYQLVDYWINERLFPIHILGAIIFAQRDTVLIRSLSILK